MWVKLDPRLNVASGSGKARGKQLGVRTGPAARRLLLRGNVDGPSSCWDFGGKAGGLSRKWRGRKRWVAVGPRMPEMGRRQLGRLCGRLRSWERGTPSCTRVEAVKAVQPVEVKTRCRKGRNFMRWKPGRKACAVPGTPS